MWEEGFPYVLFVTFSASPDHLHYFIKLDIFFCFAKTHGKEEEILRLLWVGDFRVPWEEQHCSLTELCRKRLYGTNRLVLTKDVLA